MIVGRHSVGNADKVIGKSSSCDFIRHDLPISESVSGDLVIHLFAFGTCRRKYLPLVEMLHLLDQEGFSR